MKKPRLTLSSLTLVLAAFLALSCGTNSQRQSQGQLQSVVVNPQTADAQSYPGGLVPFTATGYYIDPYYTVSPLSVDWAACQQDSLTTDVSVTRAGVAQCASGATGTYSIHAVDFIGTGQPCPMVLTCGGGAPNCTVVGTAQLTCP